jgi:tetratricopeptide (TPR) repeat protein
VDAKIIDYLKILHERDDFEGIVRLIHNIPRDQWNYELMGRLASAYNNLDFYDQAIELLESCKDQGINDHYWHFRKAYAHFYKDEDDLALIGFQKALELLPEDKDTLWFLGQLNNSETNTASNNENGIYWVAQLNAKLQPIDRGEYFEDPLTEMLEENDLGHVSGGGTALKKGGEVDYCDIEINVSNTDERVSNAVVHFLNMLGAPKGSKLKIDNEHHITFGVTEGLAIYLNGTDLPESVYQDCDINFAYSELARLIEPDKGRVLSYWQGPSDTAFYLYGNSFETMKSLIADFVAEYPLCEKCRIEKVA